MPSGLEILIAADRRGVKVALAPEREKLGVEGADV